MNSDDKEIQLEDINKIVSTEESVLINTEKASNNKKMMLVKALVVGSLVLGALTLLDLFADNKVMIFAAPVVNNLDSPQRLQRLDEISSDEMEKFLHDSIRKYLRARYPKNSKELKFMYEYIRNHSSGTIKSDFNSRLQNLQDAAEALDRGKIISLYVKNSLNVVLVKKDGGSVWSAEIPVRKVKRVGVQGDERTDPDIRMTIELNKPTLENEGFTVTKYEEVWTKDPVSKNTIILNK